MVFKFALFLAGFAVLCSGQQSVKLEGDKWKWVIQNFSGFNLYRWNETWTVNTDSESTIKLLCDEIKLPKKIGNVCAQGKLVFNDGKKETTYCGDSENVLIKGTTSKMVIDFVIPQNSGAVFLCRGKSVHAPRSYENIDVKAGASVKVTFPEVLQRDEDKAYRFKSTTGSPITLTCTKKMEKPLSSGECVKDILTIDAGKGPQASCGTGQVSATGTEITMRVETFQLTKGQVSCVVKG